MERLFAKCLKLTILSLGISLSAFAETPLHPKPASMSDSQRFSGMCDASGVVALSADYFVVANDEDNCLRIYNFKDGGAPVASFDVSGFLGLKSTKEADLEAGVRLGDRIFWIGSHGRNKDGEERPARHQFFATRLTEKDGTFELDLVGKPYTHLLADLTAHPKLAGLGLAEASKLAPKAMGGFNIEGLCETPDGHLLIGFRNPVPKGKALLVPLLNPDEVVEGARAKLGDPVLLDLGGLSIRDILLRNGIYLILAGAFDGNDTSHLYEWDGKSAPRRVTDIKRESGNPEALLPDSASSDSIRILLDNGSTLIDGKACKDVKDPERRFFEVITLKLPNQP